MLNRRVGRRSLLASGAALGAGALLAACGAPAVPTATTAAKPAAEPTKPAAAEPTKPAAAAATKPAEPTKPAAVAAPTNTPPAAAATKPAEPTKPAAAAAPAAAGAKDRLRLLWWQAPTILNSHLAQGTKDYDAARPVLEPLAATGPDGKPVAMLAADVPTVQNGGVSNDLKTVTWKLKQGIKWSDGSDFTADDVVFTYQYIADEKTAATDSTTAEGVDKVEAKDKYTVVVTWKEPNPNPYQLFVSGLGNIIQKKQFEGFMGENAKNAPGNLKPIGTGPYMVKEFKPGDVVVYEPNPNYRNKDKVVFKEVSLKGGGDATSAARAVFQTGEVDYAWNLQVEATILRGLAEAGKGELVSAISPNVERLLINRADPNKEVDGARSEPSTKHPFFSDLNVRKAFAMALDRKVVADQLYGAGLSGEATSNILTAPPDVASKNTANMDVAKYDPVKAGQLLDDAGWKKGSDGIRTKDGMKMKITYQTTVNPVRQKTQDIVKKQWEAIGIQVELKTVDAGVFFSSAAGNPDTASHFYTDVEMFTNGSEQPDPTNYLGGWITKQISQKSNEWKGNNYERFSSQDYDSAFEAFRKEVDPEKRALLASKLNDILVQDVVVIPLVARKSPISGKSKELKGIQANPWDSELWNIADWTK
ncbi:MAG TPA: peptide ABC transporter substrate-binding protein [Chloroflexota bacterium]